MRKLLEIGWTLSVSWSNDDGYTSATISRRLPASVAVVDVPRAMMAMMGIDQKDVVDGFELKQSGLRVYESEDQNVAPADGNKGQFTGTPVLA
jgi:hypothetical protein